MKVYNLTDVAPFPELSSVAPRPIQFGDVLLLAGESVDLEEGRARQLYSSMAPDVALNDPPEWYTKLRGAKDKKAQKAPKVQKAAPKEEPKVEEPKAEPKPKAKKTRKRKKS